MLGLDILDVAIGVVFVFCLLSLLATSLRELIETWLQVRAVTLEQGIRELLNDPDGTQATDKLFKHPLISSLFRGTYDPAKLKDPIIPWAKKTSKRYALKSNLPAYIPARNFALALMDFAGADGKASVSGSGEPLTIDRLKAGIAQIPEERIKQAMLVAVDQAEGKIENVRVNIEKWFDSSMDRVSGWYRKHTQWLILIIGLVLAIGLNVDTLRLASTLQTNSSLRSVVVAEAEATVTRVRTNGATDEKALSAAVTCGEAKLPDGVSCAQHRLESMGFPVGWNKRPAWIWEPGFWASKDSWLPNNFGAWLAALFGWLITAVAISIGAPFWFDTLNRLMVIRSTVKPHEKSREEGSEDRQNKEKVLALKVVGATE
ncbi:MAG: hypothetical protein V4574_19345 [Pseudomonadota bacterium]